MIYLLQDCYKDNKGEYHDILKIGYSKDSFSRNRQGQYNTHNFGYKFLGEREGSCELENYLHKLLKEYNLSREWFRYSQEIIDKFWKVSEEDISGFTSQDELNEYIRYYILKHLVPSVNKLKELYLDQILSEIKEKDTEYEEYKDIYKRSIIEVFEFVSTGEYEYFSNLKFDSQENIEILKKCNLTLPQIVGRQRNRENSFKNNIVIFYKTIQGENIEDIVSFEEKQKQRRESTYRLLKAFSSQDELTKNDLLKKLKSDIEVSKYSDDYVSISKKTGEPVYNSFIEIANERAWEVAQVDYQDKINVTRSIFNEGYTQEEFHYEEDKILSEFLDNKFYMTGIFEEKMKMYCEFMDKYGNNKYILDSIIHKIDPKFKTYYDLYGTSGCRSISYHEVNLKQGISDNMKNPDIKNNLISIFKIGSRYTLKDIKTIVKDTYSNLNISKTPKASDLESYFDVSEIKITDKTTGKRSKGYLILGIK